MMLPSLVPFPRQVELTGGSCSLAGMKFILMEASQPQTIFFAASRLQNSLQQQFGLFPEIHAGRLPGRTDVAITLRITLKNNLPPQGYQLSVTPSGIDVGASADAGIFYACCSLMQLFQNYSPLYHPEMDVSPGTLPCLVITDWPDFPNRGVLLDISRDKVPTMETMFSLVDLLASWKINQLQLYTEHTFAYAQHPEVWAAASPFTGEEILRLDAFCRQRFVELVPNQNSFGHLERWLKLPRYQPLAEAPDGFDVPWGHQDGPFSLCPVDKGSLAFLKGLYDELLPHFSSRQFNVGCDETFDVGQGRSKAECERVGTGRVYLDFLKKIYQQVSKRGFRMQFWGDIVMAYPELVPELPDDCIALEWGYEADHPFDEHGEKFSKAGLAFYVCPGTSAWNSLAGRTDNCLANLANAAQNGLKHGASGYLITDWGDHGHWQTLPISYLGFLAGAAYAWWYPANRDLDIRKALAEFAFQDISSNMGNLAYDLGNIYHMAGFEPPNASALFYMLQNPFNEWNETFTKNEAGRLFHDILEKTEDLRKYISGSRCLRGDRQLLLSEFSLTINMIEHSCKRALLLYSSNEYTPLDLRDDLKDLIKKYRQVWLKRNRPGGLRDSLSRFKTTEQDYH